MTVILVKNLTASHRKKTARKGSTDSVGESQTKCKLGFSAVGEINMNRFFVYIQIFNTACITEII